MSAAMFGTSQGVVDAFVAAGHTATIRETRAGNRRVSLDGRPETDIHTAMVRIERTLTADRAWPWQREKTA